MKRITPTPTPDNTGSRAATTAHFSSLLISWRRRGRVSRATAAAILCCSERTIAAWERSHRAPRGITRRAITAYLSEALA